MRRLSALTTILFLICIIALVSGIASIESHAEQPINVEILFMNHGPMQPTIRNLKSLFKSKAGNVQTSWFDFDQQSGKAFMKKKGLRGHIPLLIYINGAHTFHIRGRRVIFMGFPTGKGPFRHVEGKWTIQDLEQVIQSLAR